jgi:phage baseplate assembly protein W
VIEVQTLPVLNVGAYIAELRASIDTKDTEVTYRFEFALGNSFISSSFTLDDTLLGGGVRLVKVVLLNLIQNTTYSYRIIASNDEGEVVGSSLSFRTARASLTSVDYDAVDKDIKPLYIDFNQYKPDSRGFLYNEEAVAQGVMNILNTPKRTRFFRPDFGCDLDKAPFEFNDEFGRDLVMSYVFEALNAFETRARIDLEKTKFVIEDEGYTFGFNPLYLKMLGGDNRSINLNTGVLNRS